MGRPLKVLLEKLASEADRVAELTMSPQEATNAGKLASEAREVAYELPEPTAHWDGNINGETAYYLVGHDARRMARLLAGVSEEASNG